MKRPTIDYIVRVMARLELLGWDTGFQELAYRRLIIRRGR
jgi:hypothetical protein